MEVLVRKAKKGDEEAFIKLIDNYMLQMYKVAKSRMSNEEAIGDAIQETIMSAFKNIKQLKRPEYFNTWLIRILINNCNSIMKDKKIDYIDDYSKYEKGDSICVDSVEDKLDFDRVLSILSDEYKEIIVLYYVNGFLIKEIAEILDIKEGTVKSRLSRAKEKLRVVYIKEYVGKDVSHL